MHTRISMLLALGALVAATGDAAAATIPASSRSVTLPEPIYVNPWKTAEIARDKDKDYLKDDLENRLADVWRPYFVFDEHENDYTVNVNDFSLQQWEPRVIFQVRPVGCAYPYCATTLRLKVQYGFLFRLDGGYRNSFWCNNYHYGDTQSGSLELISTDSGKTWWIDKINMWSGGTRWATDPEIEWASSYTILGSKSAAKIYMSAGKHHQGITAAKCEDLADSPCDDDCGGGYGYDLHGPGRGSGPRYANLQPWGYFLNVGEPELHPMGPYAWDQWTLNQLWHIGYANEHTWFAAWQVDGKPTFTGGTGTGWKCDWVKCDVPSPVYSLFSSAEFSPRPLY